jgi:hypothetical protein
MLRAAASSCRPPHPTKNLSQNKSQKSKIKKENALLSKER